MSDATTDIPLEEVRQNLLDAALPEVPFSGWSSRTWAEAARSCGIDQGHARLAFPRKGLDMLLFFHETLDRETAARIAAEPLEGRFRDRVEQAVRMRIEAGFEHRDALLRGAAYLSLPLNIGEGVCAIWQTSDMIWTSLGDRSPRSSPNWYSKRATLSGIYAATSLHWMSGEDEAKTWEFLHRRIGDVMRFEQTKARMRESTLVKCSTAFTRPFLRKEKPGPPAPGAAKPVDLPGSP